MRSNTGKIIKPKTGKSNLDIVRSYLSGERAFIQVGYDENVALAQRKEGEEWTDGNGNHWVKKNGCKQRVSKKGQYILEQRCIICNADMKWGNRLDQKIYPKTQKCYECNIEFEGVLKSLGLYNDYEKYKLINNEISIIKDFKAKIVDSINYLESLTSETKNPQFFNEDGSNEIWVDDTDRKEIVLKDLKNDLKLAEERLTLASEELSKLKYLPEKDEDRIKKLTLEKINNKELNKFS
jgi:hypothetical protein